jgi:hypothetical protein
MVIYSNIYTLDQIITLIDTGASGNFIQKDILEQLKVAGHVVNIKSCDIALRLADNKTIETNGIVCLPMSINNQEIQVSLYVLTEAAYPLILGCEFLEKHNAILRFCYDRRELELSPLIQNTNQSKPTLKLVEPLELSPYSYCFTECSVNIIPGLQGTYLVEPNNELFAEKGILISRAVVAVGSGRLIISFANVTSSEVTLESDETLGDLEPYSTDTSDGTIKIICIDSQTVTNEQNENLSPEHDNNDLILKLEQTIPKLNIDLTLFTPNEATEIAKTLLKYADLFDTTKTSYGAARGVEHIIETNNGRAINQIPHRVSPKECQMIAEMTNEMVTN